MIENKISCKIEEFPSLAAFVRESFVRDLNEFKAFNPRYNDEFSATLDADLRQLNNLVNNKLKLGQAKLLTQQLHEGMAGLRPHITRIEGYIRSASGLTTVTDSFMVKELRMSISKNDAEGVVGAAMTLLQNAQNNMDVLTAEGYTGELHTLFSGLISNISEINNRRNVMLNEKEKKVQENHIMLNNLWKKLQNIMDTGKRLYKYSDMEKTQEYTVAKVMSRIRKMNNKEVNKKEVKSE